MEKRDRKQVCERDILLIGDMLSRGLDVCIQNTPDGGYRIVSQKTQVVRRHKAGEPVLRFGAAKQN